MFVNKAHFYSNHFVSIGSCCFSLRKVFHTVSVTQEDSKKICDVTLA